MKIKEQIERLHDCKRGLSTGTPRDYNQWWRTMKALVEQVAELEKQVSDAGWEAEAQRQRDDENPDRGYR